MKRLRLVLWLLPLSLFCLTLSHAEQIDWEIASLEKVSQPPQSVTLAYKFSEGEVRRYDVRIAGTGSLKLPGQGADTKLQSNCDLSFEEHVMRGQADGTWRISRKLVKGEMTLPDFGKLPVSMPTLEAETDKRGALRSISGLDQLSSTFGMAPNDTLQTILTQLKSVGLPDKELTVGDTWEDAYKVELPGHKAIAIAVKSTLEGFDRVMKTDCATIVTRYEAPFSFPLAEEPAEDKIVVDSKTAATSSNARALVGKEKGEFRTHFSYVDGRIVQSFGTVELIADLQIDSSSESKPAAEAAGAADPAKVEHALDVKHYVTSVFGSSVVKDVKQTSVGGAK